jgi:hypothetical protein
LQHTSRLVLEPVLLRLMTAGVPHILLKPACWCDVLQQQLRHLAQHLQQPTLLLLLLLHG